MTDGHNMLRKVNLLIKTQDICMSIHIFLNVNTTRQVQQNKFEFI